MLSCWEASMRTWWCLLFVRSSRLLLGSPDHLAKLIFLGKLARENTQILDKFITRSDDGLFRGDFPIGLDTENETRNKRMGHLEWRQSVAWAFCGTRKPHAYLVASEENMRVLQEARADHVAESMVLLVESEYGRRRDTCDTLVSVFVSISDLRMQMTYEYRLPFQLYSRHLQGQRTRN